MPCYQTGSREGDLELSLEEARKANTKTTRLLCQALSFLEDDGRLPDLSEELQAWWQQHKKVDSARKDREAKEKAAKLERKRALAKLTAGERRALGLDEK